MGGKQSVPVAVYVDLKYGEKIGGMVSAAYFLMYFQTLNRTPRHWDRGAPWDGVFVGATLGSRQGGHEAPPLRRYMYQSRMD
jgi:hypothetical protein